MAWKPIRAKIGRVRRAHPVIVEAGSTTIGRYRNWKGDCPGGAHPVRASLGIERAGSFYLGEDLAGAGFEVGSPQDPLRVSLARK